MPSGFFPSLEIELYSFVELRRKAQRFSSEA